MRTAFINQLLIEAETNDKIFLIVGDLGFSVVEPFRDKFPKRFLNTGVAEQNMTCIAAGLAMEGYKVFTYSIANFPTLRCIEQIRYDICYHNLDVKIVAVGGGYSYGALGASHHATEDIGMLRTIPNISVCAPGDPMETKKVTSHLSNSIGPAYLRLGKAGELNVLNEDFNLDFPNSRIVLSGNDTAVLSTGSMLKYSFDYITNNKLNWSLYSFPYIKPLHFDVLPKIANKYKQVITIEEHQKQAGFGSAILEAFNDFHESGTITQMPKIKRIAIPDRFINVAGTQEYLREIANLKF